MIKDYKYQNLIIFNDNFCEKGILMAVHKLLHQMFEDSDQRKEPHGRFQIQTDGRDVNGGIRLRLRYGKVERPPNCGCTGIAAITHWMPLPEPPK